MKKTATKSYKKLVGKVESKLDKVYIKVGDLDKRLSELEQAIMDLRDAVEEE